MQPASDGRHELGSDASGTSRRALAARRALLAVLSAADACRQRTVAELMEDISSACFYRVEVRLLAGAPQRRGAESVRQGWWTFELCVRKHVRQFHQEKDLVVSEYVLGRFDEPATARLHADAGQSFSEEASPTGAATRCAAARLRACSAPG